MYGPPRLATRSPPWEATHARVRRVLKSSTRSSRLQLVQRMGDLLILQDARAKRNGKSLTAYEGARMEWRRRWLARVPSLSTLDLLQGIACMSPPKRLTASAALDHSVLWPLALVKRDGERYFDGGRGNFAVQSGHLSPRVLSWLLGDPLFAEEAMA